MQENEPSRTARRVAIRRAAHQILDTPLIFEDPLALKIIGASSEAALQSDPKRAEGSPFATYLRAFIVARSRFTEDVLQAEVAQGVGQYVVLGAGLDTFAYRNPYPNLKVFEVDYPATQAWKRELLNQAAIPIPQSLTFVPLDFETNSLTDTLGAAKLNLEAPTFFSWLGVTPYLSPNAIESTLRLVGSLAQGSGIVFDYAVSPATLTDRQKVAFNYMSDKVARAGEPWRTFFEPALLVDDLHRYGFNHVEDLDGVEINSRYFSRRLDGFMVGNLSHLLVARV